MQSQLSNGLGYQKQSFKCEQGKNTYLVNTSALNESCHLITGKECEGKESYKLLLQCQEK